MRKLPEFRALTKNAHRFDLVKNKADESTLYVYGLIGDIGWDEGISAIDFAKAVAAAPKGTLHVRVNSPGGDVFEGLAMAQALREYDGKAIVHVDGVAASAATFLLCAGAPVVMAQGSMLMVHNAWTIVGGNAEDLLQQAAILEKIDGKIAENYASRTGVTKDQARAWMAAETWFTDQEAVENKFADTVAANEDGSNARAAWDLSAYANAPKAVAAKDPPAANDPPEPPPDNAAELSHAHAKRRFSVIEKSAA